MTSPQFAQRVAVLATMHRKEQVIAPLLKQHLNLEVVVPTQFNTDKFGTFTRDIPRQGNQLEAARAKAQQALQITGKTIAIASEGTFGPHPSIPYIACNRELVLLLDQEHNLEIAGYAISTETNYSHTVVTTLEDALAFAQTADFPEHGLIVMPKGAIADSTHIIKGIDANDKLKDAVNWALTKFGSVHLETDMRAMHNPTRMKVIAQATQNLIQKIQQRCPQCQWPGFDVVERRSGLPCSWCSLPTELTLALIYQCKNCDFQQEQLFPNGQSTASPEYCSYCNP
jgi:hypothetical protein